MFKGKWWYNLRDTYYGIEWMIAVWLVGVCIGVIMACEIGRRL